MIIQYSQVCLDLEDFHQENSRNLD